MKRNLIFGILIATLASGISFNTSIAADNEIPNIIELPAPSAPPEVKTPEIHIPRKIYDNRDTSSSQQTPAPETKPAPVTNSASTTVQGGGSSSSSSEKKEISIPEKSTPIVATENKTKIVVAFQDVNSTNWYYNFVIQAAQKEYMKGMPDGYFRPQQLVTRAEVAEIITNYSSISNAKLVDKLSPKDVDSNAWYSNAVKQTISSGLFSGYPDNTFRAENKITT